MSVEEREQRIEHTRALLLRSGYEDVEDYNAEMAWILSQPVTS